MLNEATATARQRPLMVLTVGLCGRGSVAGALWPGLCRRGSVAGALSAGLCRRGSVAGALSPGLCRRGSVCPLSFLLNVKRLADHSARMLIKIIVVCYWCCCSSCCCCCCCCMYSAHLHHTVHSVHCILQCTIQCTRYSAQCAPYRAQCALYRLHHSALVQQQLTRTHAQQQQ
jgi:hypothetical protein